MNQGIYQLVFSKIHHAMVVVSEVASSRAGEGRTRSRRAAGIWLALSMLPGPWMVMSAWADLPAGIQIRDIVNESTKVISSTTNQITFQQLKPQAIVNYDKLNLGAGQQFNVNMQAGWSMLNRVHSVDPSVINGNVNAAGNIYFVNANGVIIGKDAVFNVGSLFAGTLNITDELFQSGFINDSGYNSVFELVDTINLTPEQAAKVNNAEVRVEAGAQINAAKGGKVMLFAPNVRVEKNAVIKTPDGQTILAAGKKIYLKGSQDPAGMLVEVASGGTATNLGKIVAERGNITMMGLAVNQMGTVSATTSIRANGSVRLIAQADTNVVNGLADERRDGIVTLGKDSVTEVTPEMGDKEEVLASLAFKTSDINIQGSLVNIDGLVSAKGGNVTVSSLFDAASVLNSSVARRIHLGEYATIDVSGVDATTSMDRFQLAVQLNSDALKDNPILRGSNLFGKTVYVDARKGTDLFDVQPYIDSTRMATVAEKMTNAGTVSLTTSNEIIAEKGSTINVSGGSTTYTAGSLKESQLVYNGKLVPISQAKTGVAYSEIGDTKTVIDPKWGTTTTYTLGNLTNKVPGFFEGANAGTVRALTSTPGTAFVQKLVLDGTMIGTTRISQQQILANDIPLGASLVASAINLNMEGSGQNLPDNFAFGDVLAGGDGFVSRINTSFLKQGFNRIDLQDVQSLNVNSALALDTNGSLTLGRLGSTVNINKNITAQGADINLNATRTRIADNVNISTAGNFVNNKTGIKGALTQQTAENAGNIQAGIVEFGNNVTLDASSGASVDSNGILHTGQAGNIGFTTEKQLPSNLTLRAYGFDKGGELSIQFGEGTQTNLHIGAGNIATDALNFSLSNSFFSQGGFSKYNLGAFNIHVGSDSVGATSMVYGVAQNLQVKSGFNTATSADNIFSVTRLITRPDYLRQAVSFDFATYRAGDDLGVLTVHENAHIKTDVGGDVQLSAGKQVNVLGDITAKGGDITLRINDEDPALPEDSSQMVFVGSNSTLDVSGSSFLLPNSRTGLEQNQIVNAGSITINSATDEQKGAVVIKQGALLNVSAANVATRTLTNRGYITETLYGDAGEISLYGYGSLLVDGKLSGQAQGTGRGGSLNMFFESVPYPADDFSTMYVNGSGRFHVTNDLQLLTTNIQAGDALKDSAPVTSSSGQLQRAQISAAQIESGGFDNVRIGTFDRNATAETSQMLLAGNLDLTVAGNLRLDSPVLQVLDDGHAKLSAGHLQLHSRKNDVDPAVLTGSGELTMNANQVYIDGLVATSGVNRTNLNVLRDIHGQGVATFVQVGQLATESGLTTQGQLNLTARQIYPDSGAKLTFTAEGADSQINVSSSGLAPSNILSGGGILTLQANKIQQDGVLKAPFGQIHLNASESVTLGAGSLTTVSGTGQNIPFGMTMSAGEVFNPGDGKTRNLVEKEISINAPDTKLGEGATIDLSGGGELFAYEWISGGVGGTQDILAQPDTYALIPTMTSDYAATDRLYNNGSAGIGQTIYITGVDGVPTGTYTLLPARYALVPGAFVVQRSDASLVRGQTSALQDGSKLTTGYMADLNTGAKDANWSTFRVINGSVFRPAEGAVSKAPSQYVITNASSYFNDPLNTGGADVKNTQDAGKLTLQAQQLALEASVVGRKITGADGLMVDISSNSIRVVNQKDNADSTSLQLQVSQLNALNAESILLGGTRSQNNNTTNINTVANTVSIENDAGQVLQTGELMATATDSVNVAAGAQIDTGARNANAKTVNVNTSGDGAFLGLSSNNQLQYTRTGSSINAQSGNLNIAANSQISAGNSLVMDGSQNVTFEGNIALADGASATLGSNRILIGDVPNGVSGLHVSDQTLSQLDNVANLTLNSYSTVDTYGDVTFGNDKLNLTVNAAGIAGHLASGEVAAPANQTVTINTKTFTLKNTVDATYAGAPNPSGRTLQINADSVRLEGDRANVLENNAVAIADKNTIGGFDAVQVNAKSLTVAEGGALDLQVNQTQLNVGRITAESSANYTIGSVGTLSTTQGNTAGLAANTNIGGKLTLQADQLNVNSRIETLSGQINLQADTQLNLGSQAVVTAASATKTYAEKTAYVDAGKVQLSSGGDIVTDAGAVVNVSAQGDADAGKVTVSATSGDLQLQGQLDGRALGTGKGGSLEVDVRALPSVVAVDQQAQGFSQSRSYRVRTGDVAVDGTGAQSLTAKQVAVTADQGAINVSGTINANSDKQGSISLNANGDVTLQSSAQLTANSSKAGAEGGKVMLATQNGALNLNQGSAISVAGGANGSGGAVHLRAPRTGAGSGNGVAVNALETTITGAKSVVLEAVKVFDNVSTLTSSGDGSGGILGYDTLASDANSFMANQASILAALGKGSDSSFHLRAGQEIRSDADINVDADWDLSSVRDGNEPGVLTLRAANNLNVNATISDGFNGTGTSAAISAGDSWSYRFVSGADMHSANVMNTLPSVMDSTGNSTSGNLTLAGNVLVRTGTGDIEIATGGDLVMSNESSVIYTAGVEAAELPGFTLPVSAQRPLYLDNGGDITLNVRGNINGAENDNRQVINQWLFRQAGGSQLKDASWWIRNDQFRQSLGALGGGDVTINAGGNIANFSASIPTSARFDNFGDGATGASVVNGGGNLSISAGGDLYSGVYFVGKGEGTIKVGGSVGVQPDKMYGTVLAMMDGQFDVSAGKDVSIEGTVNPTLLPQSTTNSPTTPAGRVHNSYFNTYSEAAAVSLNSLTGNIRYATQLEALLTGSTGLRAGIYGGMGLNPGTVNMAAHNGSITMGQAYLVPASKGNLSLLAEQTVSIDRLMMSDANISDLPNINRPEDSAFIGGFTIDNSLLSNTLPYFNNHATSLLHANDFQTSFIVSKSGDVRSYDVAVPGLIYLPKATQIVAGQDVSNLNIGLQNNRTSDISVIAAGRDVNTKNVVIGGPGELLVQAGRNVDLIYTDVTTIQATGSTGTKQGDFQFTPASRANTLLPAAGSSISMLAGVGAGAKVQDYIERYIAPTGAGPDVLEENASALNSYKAKTAAYLLAFMKKLTGNDTLTEAEAFTQFNAQSNAVKTVFVNRHLTTELISSAQSFAKAGNHDRGNDALAALYPTKAAGDILLFNSKISTNSGGSIDLVAPGGLINVGVPGQGGDDIGIITEKGGEIRAIADGDFSVNQSKVITQFGSDIAIWSTNGTIDAGRGSKTATSVPERIVQTDVFGNTIVEVRGVASGSGIRAQTYDPDGPNGPQKAPTQGNVFLTAPVVDAGEAGIQGIIQIVAPVVLNAGNIQASAGSTGVPTTTTTAVAGLNTTTNPDSVNAAAQAVAQSVANSAVNNAFTKPVLPSIISVDVIGIGR
ncbi:filamentous haemagglutinin family protein [Methylophilus sp. Leaf414]|uniref:filamentous haemagglutinin family protein n=1 Tax=Methylophilus sp. Leaf414 TaxID=1736371 RepID=UPI0006FE4B47|nr:filamentous haemagglutinin family protein [Methylophilus sp. Leaf414]KQT33937.1 filamentous hemagglutinin [Methylophilus sp. Leaf414]